MTSARDHTPEQVALLGKVKAAARQLGRAEARFEAARENRNAAIITAIEAGVSPYFATRAAGKSHTLGYALMNTATCSVEECTRPAKITGLCNVHYARQRRARGMT